MNGSHRSVVLITGASSGIGEACASYLYGCGYRVFGASRRIGEAALPAGIVRVAMDVDNDSSVTAAVEAVVAQAGRIDVVVNSAGYSLVGAVEEMSLEEVKAQLETNLFGVWRVCRAVLPVMRRQGSGCIINLSSLAGRIGLPFQAPYCASKFALEGFTESLSTEIRPFGIHAVLIEPGNFRTPLTARRVVAAGAAQSTIYGESFWRVRQVIERDELQGPAPEGIARVVHRIINTRSPRLRYTV